MQDSKMNEGLAPPAEPPVRETSSSSLFAGARELVIRHSGGAYRLRQTAKGGLILTK
ncbi:MAG: hypothetical protein Kilf2KO_07570 [Rhodospirillales bacterium]